MATCTPLCKWNHLVLEPRRSSLRRFWDARALCSETSTHQYTPGTSLLTTLPLPVPPLPHIRDKPAHHTSSPCPTTSPHQGQDRLTLPVPPLPQHQGQAGSPHFLSVPPLPHTRDKLDFLSLSHHFPTPGTGLLTTLPLPVPPLPHTRDRPAHHTSSPCPTTSPHQGQACSPHFLSLSHHFPTPGTGLLTTLPLPVPPFPQHQGQACSPHFLSLSHHFPTPGTGLLTTLTLPVPPFPHTRDKPDFLSLSQHFPTPGTSQTSSPCPTTSPHCRFYGSGLHPRSWRATGSAGFCFHLKISTQLRPR